MNMPKLPQIWAIYNLPVVQVNLPYILSVCNFAAKSELIILLSNIVLNFIYLFHLLISATFSNLQFQQKIQ